MIRPGKTQLHRRDVRLCRQLVTELHDAGRTGEEFLRAAGAIAGGRVEVLRPPREMWAQVMPGNITGVTLPYPGGWMTVVPAVRVAESTIFGHEAAHIVFGDVPHWDRARAATRRMVEPLAASLAPEPLLTAAASGQAESVMRHDDELAERRAELLGALLESRRLRPGDYARDRVDEFFAVRDDR